jgi:uncharacterized SAM-binding protein YcdF (DUF218 family)
MFLVFKLLLSLLAPSSLLVLLAAAGLALRGLGRTETGSALLGLGIGGLLACLVLPVASWSIRPLENRFPRPAPPAHVDGIILLGGSVEPFSSADHGQPIIPAAAERLTEFVALARRYPEARLVFTGGSWVPGGPTEAAWTATLLDSLGLPPGRVTFETRARTTWENALDARALVTPQPGQTWLLVTSASHMPRAVGVFRHAGWDVVAWPAGYRSRQHGSVEGLPPLSARLNVLDTAAHEWVGLLAYRLMGRTDSLFPGP